MAAVKIIRTAPKPKKLANGESELAVVYARYSSHAQGEQSIEGQLAAARTYAAAKGYTIIHEYIDRAKTGKNDNREAFQQMLTDTATRQFTVIIVWKVDRFGRNRPEMAINKQICYANGVRIEYVAETLSDGPEAVLLESLLEGMAEYYSLQLAQNVKRGLLENAKKGLSVGGTVPLGYKLNKETRKYELDPKMAPIVREIFQRYANGKMMMQIVSWLNLQGIVTPRGGPFTKSSLAKLLHNEKYIGVYKYQDIRIEDGVPAIVDEKTFWKVQEMLATNRTRKSSDVWNIRDYLLSDRCFCGRCGAPMVGMSGAGKMGVKYSYYACTKHLREKTCDKKAIRQDVLEPLVLRMTKSLLQDEELMTTLADQVYAYLDSQDEAAEKRTALEAQLADVDKSIAGLTKAIESGLFNEAIKTRMEELDGQRQALRTTIADLELRNAGKTITREQIDFFLHRFRDADLNLPECQKRFIKTFVNAVYVFDDRVSVAFNCSDDDQETLTLSDLIEGESAFVQRAPSSTKPKKSEHHPDWGWVRISSFYLKYCGVINKMNERRQIGIIPIVAESTLLRCDSTSTS